MNLKRIIELYRLMLTAREIDEHEKHLVAQNLAHFHVSCAGHEGMAALAVHLIDSDWLQLHYRDKALLLARGMPIEEFFRSLLGRLGSHSQGRQMSAHFSVPELKICSMVGPVGNNALQAVGIAAAINDNPEKSIVVCSVGDGTTQQGEFLEAIAEAVRWQLPVLFIIEDNRYSISTPTTAMTFFDLPTGPIKEFYGLDICRIDGTDVCVMDTQLEKLVDGVRNTRSPGLAVIHFERLTSHTNSDDQMLYRKAEEITHIQNNCDPLTKVRQLLLDQDFAIAELLEIEAKVRNIVKQAVQLVQSEPSPTPTTLTKAPYPREVGERKENRGDSSPPRLTMREAINGVLKAHLTQNLDVFLYGQDIEDPKGDVFGVTKGLSTAFPKRVINACLSESTIIGTAIGRALAGQRPVAFIQFADFLPLAFNQILSELGSMFWRTDGGWQCPVIIMVSCGAYKPGLGPFHAQTMEGFLTHVPGIDVLMPSTAADAAGLLNAAFISKRPTVFLYPKSCLNNIERSTSVDVDQQFVIPGKARKISTGKDLTLVSWGYPITFCEEIVKLFNENGSSIELFDLRSLSPWDKTTIIASVEKTGRLLVIHEDNHTGGFGAEILATIAETVNCLVQLRRVTRPDTYIPYHYASQLEILPSYKQSVQACAELLDYDLKWLQPEMIEISSEITVNAMGSGPADENVEVINLLVQVGNEIQVGDVVAVVEATKSIVEICSAVSGKVQEIRAKVGDIIPVNAPLFSVQAGDETLIPPKATTEQHADVPHLTKRPPISTTSDKPSRQQPVASTDKDHSTHPIYLCKPSCVLGGRIVSSEELASNIEGWSAEEVIKRTGVQTRHWSTQEDNVVSLAIRACEKLFSSLDNTVPPVSIIICSTTTPRESSPSVACQVATHFSGHEKLSEHYMAFDFNAACTGFLYGLRIAHDFLQNNPQSSVLLITSEVPSPMLNFNDPATVFLFGDAASASLVTTQSYGSKTLKVNSPLLMAIPDPGPTIHLPCFGTAQYLHIDSIPAARTAYKAMVNAVDLVMAQDQLENSDISALLPHPGSQRILQNVAEHLNLPFSLVRTTVADTGNTSSSSIPLALERYWDELPSTAHIVMTAFGAGFTAAATTAQFIEVSNMNNIDVLTNEVINWLNKFLCKEVDPLKLDAALVEDYGASSIDIVDIVNTMETKYGLTITNEQVRDIKTINDVLRMIQAHINKAVPTIQCR